MKPHAINQMDNFICGWYANDTSLCDSIVKWFEDLPMEKKFMGSVASPEIGVFQDYSAKKSTESVLNQNVEIYNKYHRYLQTVLDEYLSKYERAASLGEFKSTSITKIQYYKPEEAYFDFHCERFGSAPPYSTRHLVYMTYLNDVEDAGETEFLYQQVKIKPEKGLTLIWPAEWTHTHRGIVSMTQNKYIATGWLNFI
jgi:hypothetical protein